MVQHTDSVCPHIFGRPQHRGNGGSTAGEAHFFRFGLHYTIGVKRLQTAQQFLIVLAGLRLGIEVGQVGAGDEQHLPTLQGLGQNLTQRFGYGLALVTDGGHWILDAKLGRIPDPQSLADRLAVIPGVVEHGLFIGMADTAILAGAGGVRILERS